MTAAGRLNRAWLRRLACMGLAAAVALCGARGTAALPPAGQASPAAPFTVLLDAAHGGPDTGTHLTPPGAPPLEEKDFTLALSVWLRSNFSARGLRVVTTREADMATTAEQRAATANRAHPGACLLLHATASGTGVHLYTSPTAPAAPTPPGALALWGSAQAAYSSDSLKLSSEIASALTQAGVPIVQGNIPIPAMDTMACPAVLVEIAPLAIRAGKSPAAPITSTAYQTRIVDALSAALVEWRNDWTPSSR